MAHRTLALTCVALAAAGALGGCDAWYRAIGKEKVVPDEFAVTDNAPLAIPPDFSLRPPRLGSGRPQEESPTAQARGAVFRVGDNKDLPPAADNRSAGEGELLKEAGAEDTPKDIRHLVETEANTDIDESFVQKLAFWRSDQKLGPTDEVINPVAESERLKSLQAQNDGSAAPAAPSALAGTPAIERTNASTHSSWFGWLANIF